MHTQGIGAALVSLNCRLRVMHCPVPDKKKQASATRKHLLSVPSLCIN